MICVIEWGWDDQLLQTTISPGSTEEKKSYFLVMFVPVTYRSIQHFILLWRLCEYSIKSIPKAEPSPLLPAVLDIR